MKLSFILILILLFTACKNESVGLLQESSIATRAITNVENSISSPSFKLVDNRGYTTFEIECSETNFYYLSVWIELPIINGRLYEYQVAVNGLIHEDTFKPSQAGWQSLLLTDNNNATSKVELLKGTNTISILSVNRETINIRDIKISQNLQGVAIDDSAYASLENYFHLKSAMSSYSAVSAIQSDEIYSYALDFPVTYTYTLSLNEMEPGQHLTFTTTTDNDFPHLIQLYSNKVNILGSDNYSWSAYGTSSATLDVTLPDWWGNYTLVIRAYNPGTTGIANLTYTERYDSQTWTREYINNFVGGNTLQVNQFISGNSFLAKTTVDNHYTGLSFEDPTFPGKIMCLGAVTQVANSSGSYIHEGFIDFTGQVTKCFLTSGVPSCSVDVYLGLDYSSSSLRSYFPNLPANNSFKSGLSTSTYNCISWSIERTDYWEWPLFYGSSYYNSNPLTAFDNLYSAYGYTRSGATVENAGIALWALNGAFTHASVTKNANTTKPHGFEWESKCGALERVMHTRDALSGNSYGSIAYYYRPINASKTIIQTTPEVVDSLPLHTLSTTLKASISLANIANFEEKYSAWKKTWDNPDIAIYSDPKKYTQSEKYSDLLQLCKDYGKASWPLFVEKLIDGDMLTINLIEDLTLSENKSLMDEVKYSAINAKSATTRLPSMYSNYVNYCTKLLRSNSINIQSSIRQIN